MVPTIVTSKMLVTIKWHPQPIAPAAHSDFAINKCCWLRLAVNQVSVVLLVSTYACMQDVQGSNHTDD